MILKQPVAYPEWVIASPLATSDSLSIYILGQWQFHQGIAAT